MKIKNFIRPGYQIEVPTAKPGSKMRPGYRWVQGWQVFDPRTGRWSVEMRWRDALNAARMIREIPT